MYVANNVSLLLGNSLVLFQIRVGIVSIQSPGSVIFRIDCSNNGTIIWIRNKVGTSLGFGLLNSE